MTIGTRCEVFAAACDTAPSPRALLLLLSFVFVSVVVVGKFVICVCTSIGWEIGDHVTASLSFSLSRTHNCPQWTISLRRAAAQQTNRGRPSSIENHLIIIVVVIIEKYPPNKISAADLTTTACVSDRVGSKKY